MSEDFGLKLLAAIEALAAEVRTLGDRLPALTPAQRAARARDKKKARHGETAYAVTQSTEEKVTEKLRTPSRTESPPLPVPSPSPSAPTSPSPFIPLPLEKKAQEAAPPSNVTELRRHFEKRFLEARGEPYYWQGPRDVLGAKALIAAGGGVDGAGKLVDAGFRIAASDGFWAKNIGLAFFGSKVNALKGQNGQARPGAASLHITPEAKRDHAIPGRKIL